MSAARTVRDRLFARLYDPLLAPAERRGMRANRRTVLDEAVGRTLELGAGTGLNLASYPRSVTSLTATEPDAAMIRLLRQRALRAGRRVEVVQASGEHLPFPDAAFDTVVCTLVLCTVADVEGTLDEVRRVLTPAGRLVLIEHVRSADPVRARWQDRLHRPWQAFAAGCHCNRDTVATLVRAGYDVEGLRDLVWRGMPPIVAPVVAGTARPAGSR